MSIKLNDENPLTDNARASNLADAISVLSSNSQEPSYLRGCLSQVGDDVAVPDRHTWMRTS